MKENVKDRPSKRLRRAATVIVTCGLVGAAAAHANAFDDIVQVPPTELPTLARQTGEPMFLHDPIDGRTLLYIEQNQGARLTAFDVTDPVHITDKGSVRLAASGTFDFVSPQLKTVPGLTVRDPIMTLGNDAFTVSGQAKAGPGDYQLLDTMYSDEINRVFDVKQVREEVTKTDMGTTSMVTENGLYVIRRPAADWSHHMMVIPPN